MISSGRPLPSCEQFAVLLVRSRSNRPEPKRGSPSWNSGSPGPHPRSNT
ncbi:hypothetical protein AB0M72_21370 [Nocardiopsis dassonvillei]